LQLPPHSYYPAPHWWLPGAISFGLLVAIAGLPVAALLVAFDFADGIAVLEQAYTWRVVRFSVWQAFLSTLLSLLLAVPMAVSLSRRGNFPGRPVLLRLFSVPLVMPTLVAITGIVVVYGHSGWLRDVSQLLGWRGDYRFYGLIGILAAHIFFNFPLATRVLLQSIDAVPSENWRIAEQFGLRGREQFVWLEWPAILRVLPAVIVLIFSLCFTSFAVVLTLGGGPGASTIEVAIYQALRLDFDIAAAVVLALLQLVICVGLLLCSGALGRPAVLGGSNAVSAPRRAPGGRLPLNAIIALGFLFVAAPLLAVIVRGVNTELVSVIAQPSLWRATGQTVLVGVASGSLAVLLASGLLVTSRHLRVRLGHERSGRWLANSGLVILVMPSIVVSAGLFLLLRHVIDVFSQAIWLVVLVNALLGLPFACAVLSDAMITAAERCDRLCAALGVLGANRLRLIEWPLIRKPLGLAMGLCSALAAGDLTAVALFGSQRFQTLPWLLYQRIGSYRIAEASATALLLLLLCLSLFWFFDRALGGAKRAET
jgi:thiamine transport system permease protein